MSNTPREAVFVFSKGIHQDTVNNFLIELNNWSANNYQVPLRINFESGGGDIDSAQMLFGGLVYLRNRGHKLTICVYGRACSCASWILQAADVRIMSEYSRLMYHYLLAEPKGNLRHLREKMKQYEAEQAQTDKIFLSRTKKLTKKELAKHLEEGDWYISPDDALKFGLIDDIERPAPFTVPAE